LQQWYLGICIICILNVHIQINNAICLVNIEIGLINYFGQLNRKKLVGKQTKTQTHSVNKISVAKSNTHVPKLIDKYIVRGERYDHNFRRFSPNFGVKLPLFLKTNVTNQFFA
jgi:hypothetical protein